MWAYDYDIDTGTISNRREFASTKEMAGVCDGSTVDADGCIWTAELVSGDIVRRTPDGKEERRIGMPVKNVTSVMFGGDNLDEIYVTSMARVDHPGSKHHQTFIKEGKPQFGAGAVFKISGLGIIGVPEPRFGG